MPSTVSILSPHKQSLYRYLDSNGDGSGTKNANLDFNASPDIFYIQPPSGTIYYLNRMIVCVEDTATMQAQEYGNLGAALSNGITFKLVNDSGTILDFLDGIPIKTNSAYGALCYDVDLKSWGAGNELLVSRWTFAKAGYPIRLDGSKNERLEANFSDDLDGLLGHYFLVQGWSD